MSIAWYYSVNNEVRGPVSEEEFNRLAEEETITPDTLVWNSAMPDWQAYGTLGLQKEPLQNTAMCVECKRHFGQDELIQYEHAYVCAECKPIFFKRLEEGGRLPGFLHYGSFWARAGAKFFDMVLLFILNYFLQKTLSPFIAVIKVGGVPLLTMFLQLLLYAYYQVYFLGKFGATPGKMLFKLKVIRADGSKLSYAGAFKRFLAEWVSSILMNIGYIIAAWDEEKRTLHDRICNTRVVVSAGEKSNVTN